MTGTTNWRDLGAALVVLVIGVGFLLWANTYSPVEAALPVLVGWLTIVLALIDAASQTGTSLGRLLRRVTAAENIVEWKAQGDGENASWFRVTLSIVWVVGYLVAIFLAGILLVTPVYIFLYMVLHGHKSLRASAITAAATTFFIWVMFEKIFQFALYPGILFGGY